MHQFLTPALLVSLLGVSVPAAAQSEPVALSLEDALAGGRVRALDAVAAGRRAEAAQALSRLARGHRLPTVRLSEQWIRTDSPADVFGLRLGQERFSFDEFVAGNPNDPDPLTVAITRLEVELPVWTGGQLTTRIEQARLASEAARLDAARVADRAAVAAAEAWIRLAQAREAVLLLERSHETVAAHADLTRAWFEQGMLVRSDLLRAEVELARIGDLLAEARGNARLAEAQVAFRLADPPDTRYRLGTLPEPPELADSVDRWLARATHRADLDAARRRLDAGGMEAKALRATRRPRVGVMARHDLVDDRLFGDHGDATTIAVLAAIDLFDGGRTRAGVAAAHAEASAGSADLQQFESGIRLETRRAWESASVALERRATARAALGAAEESVRIIEERFRAGAARSLDLLDAVTARRESQLRELVARADAWLARIHLALAAGQPPETALASSNPPSGRSLDR